MILLLAFAAAAMPLPQPSAVAVALARAVKVSALPPTPNSIEEAARWLSGNMLQTTLAWRGPGCDPTLPACSGAAARIAQDAAPQLIKTRQEANARFVAVVFDETMSPAQMQTALSFVGTPAGAAFAHGLALAANPQAMSATLRDRLSVMMAQSGGFDESRLAERFYDETKDLPRRTLPRVVRPPSSPAALPQ